MKIFGSITRLLNLVFRQNGQDITLRPNATTPYSTSSTNELPPGDSNHILVSEAAIQTLSNKTISGSANTLTNIPNSATTATASNTASTIVARDASNNFTAGTITANLTGNADTATTAGNVTGVVAVANGGTGATDAGNARSNLGLGTAAIVNTGTSSGNVPILDGSGLLAIGVIPPAALERLVIVADQAARYALTTATVQLGDTVKQTDTGVMYFVKDEANLGNAAGYSEYTAGTAAAVAASGITGQVAVVNGGTGADLSATGGSGQYLKQASSGAAVTVGTIPAADYPTMVGDSGSGGTKGAVPAPAIGDATKFLRGDATWVTVSTNNSYAEDWDTADTDDFTITHSLSTQDVHVTIYERSSPYAEIGVDLVEHLTVNTVRVKASEAPPAGGWRIVVTK
jgi:hypothetical protein